MKANNKKKKKKKKKKNKHEHKFHTFFLLLYSSHTLSFLWCEQKTRDDDGK